LFHAKNRIIREMSPHHPDYKAAKSALGAIYSKIQTPEAYPKPEDLQNDFKQWLNEYSIVCAEISFTANEKANLLGNICLLNKFYLADIF